MLKEFKKRHSPFIIFRVHEWHRPFRFFEHIKPFSVLVVSGKIVELLLSLTSAGYRRHPKLMLAICSSLRLRYLNWSCFLRSYPKLRTTMCATGEFSASPRVKASSTSPNFHASNFLRIHYAATLFSLVLSSTCLAFSATAILRRIFERIWWSWYLYMLSTFDPFSRAEGGGLNLLVAHAF